jgi:hypothetical protein
MRKLEEGRIESLPKWAQREIKVLKDKLEQDRQYFACKLREMAGDTDTPIRVVAASDLDAFLPLGTTVRYGLKNGDELEVLFSDDRTCIRIYKDSPRGDRLSINPWSTNVVEVL